MLTLRGREQLVARRDDGVRRTAELLERHHDGDRRAGQPAVRAHAGAVGRDGAQERARRRRHRSVRGRDGRARLHGVHDAVPGQPPHAPPRHPLPELPRRREPPAHRLPPRSVHRAPGDLAGADRRPGDLRRASCAPTTRGCARSTRRTCRARRARRCGRRRCSAWPSARCAGRWATRSNGCCRSGWRFHLGRRAAQRAPARTWCSIPGILKLHLSDHRRRVLENVRRSGCSALRERWSGAGRARNDPGGAGRRRSSRRRWPCRCSTSRGCRLAVRRPEAGAAAGRRRRSGLARLAARLGARTARRRGSAAGARGARGGRADDACSRR